MLRAAVVIAVPDAVQLVLGLGAVALNFFDEVVTHRLAVVALR